MPAKKRHIRVVPYDPDWPARYQVEAQAIGLALSDNLVEIHHVGSTSVPGLAAKPIIDILPIVSDIKQLDLQIPEIAAIGYEAKGGYGLLGQRYFRKLEGLEHPMRPYLPAAGP